MNPVPKLEEEEGCQKSLNLLKNKTTKSETSFCDNINIFQ
jgi:hypothetical protein